MCALHLNSGALFAPTGSSPEATRFLARQPIFNHRRRIIGYEMLFRSGWTNSFSGDLEAATLKTIDNLLVCDTPHLSDHKLSFVNFTRRSLLDGLATLLPSESTVIEILETIDPDDEVISACQGLKRKGYRLALDDFVMRAGMEKLVELADYIKIDFRTTPREERQSLLRALRGVRVGLVAEKIEDVREFNSAADEGFTHFQGYFFCRPTIIARHEVPPSQVCALGLLSALSRSPIQIVELERVIKGDPQLCYRLLRLVNSPLYAIRNRVDSVRGALMLIGEQEFRKLAMVALAGSLATPHAEALLFLSLQRARFCELFAPYIGQNPNEQYLVGLLSAADAILELPMPTIVRHLPLTAGAQSALLGERNAVARGLSIARRYETGDWNCSVGDEWPITTDPVQMSTIYAESVRWTDRAVRTPIDSGEQYPM